MSKIIKLSLLMPFLLMFTGCATKWTSKKLPRVQHSDKVIVLKGQEFNELFFKNIEKKPETYKKYNISSEPIKTKGHYEITVREIKYSDFKDWYKYGTWDHKATYDTYIYTSNMNKKFNAYEDHTNSIIYKTYCETKKKNDTCKPNMDHCSDFYVYMNGRRTYGYNKYIFKKINPKNFNDIEALRQKIFKFIKKYDTFPLRKVLSTESEIIKPKQIEIKNLPKWLKAEIYSKNNRLNIDLFMNTVNKSFFKEHPKMFGIDKDYLHLIPKYLKKDMINIKIGLKNSNKYETVKVAFYHLPGIYKEIERLKALGFGYVKFTSNQDKVDIFIDNLKRGTITKKKPFVAKLTEGQHNVLAKKYLFGSKSINIKIEADDAFAYHFDLKPSGNMYEEIGSGKIVQSTGELVVLSSRNDLEVDIDGAVRIPPFKLPNMATGKYKIKITGPGIKKYIKIEVIPNKKNIINLDDLL